MPWRTLSLFVGTILILSAACSAVDVPPIARAAHADRKVIEWGWGTPDPIYVHDHVREMEQLPFDGLVFDLTANGKPSNTDTRFSWQVWGSRILREEDFSLAIDALKSTQFVRFTDNFLRFNAAPGNIDWYDDSFNSVLSNARLAAKVSRQCGLKGLLLDVEHYNGHPFASSPRSGGATHSFDDYRRKVRERGREFMSALAKEYPGITILLTYGYDLSSQSPKEYGLLAPFLDGMVEAASPGTLIFDGWEYSYGYKKDAQFQDARSVIVEQGAKQTAVEPAFRQHYRASFGLWIDNKGKVWDRKDFGKNYFSPEEFETSIRAALRHTDRYVWIYSQQAQWWEGGVPQAYIDALRRAKGEQ